VGAPPKQDDTGALGRLGLGPIDQVSYVVADLERALPRYEAMFGPFQTGTSPLPDCTIRGRRADCVLKLAVNNAGPVEIELIEVLEGDTPHSEHLRAHGEGLHHVRFRVDDLDAKLPELETAGYRTVFEKRFGPNVAFAYLEAPEEIGGSLVELLQMPDAG
jgi:catechol 2,3-dioxygenase-like lactoylglutathione lyase family enzyme